MSQLTAKDISARLAHDAEGVARYLLGSNGKKQGAELRYGSLGGEEGQSLGIHLTGPKAGVWCDFASGETDDLLGLWAQSRNLSVSEAMREAKKYLGLEDIPVNVRGKPSVRPVTVVTRPEGVHGLREDGKTFLQDVRHISLEAATAYKIGQAGSELVFPSLSPAGELQNTKFRRFPTDAIRTVSGGAKALFGWQAIPTNARSVVICEGEYKALLWFDYGYPALSVPFGAGKGKQDWIENDYDWLAQFDTIYLALDDDEQGHISTDECIQRLGADRCAVVALPPGVGKDIAACRKAGVTGPEIKAVIEAAAPRGPEELKNIGDYRDDMVAMFGDNGPEIGLRTPWKKVGDSLVFRPGELTIVAGRTGHGKSQLVGMLLCHAMKEKLSVCVGSFEFKVQGWLYRLIRQFTGMGRPTPTHAGNVVDWLSHRMWAIDAQGTADWRRMIDVFKYCRRRHDVNIFLVDNLTGLGIHEEDYQGQKEVVQALTNFCRDDYCHTFLVHHVRKPSQANEHDQPTQSEIKGSGSITDLASTVLTVFRNKSKEEKVKIQRMGGEAIPPELYEQPDVRVKCSKQRNYYGLGDGEPAIALWFDPESFQYLSGPDHKPRPFVTADRLLVTSRDEREAA